MRWTRHGSGFEDSYISHFLSTRVKDSSQTVISSDGPKTNEEIIIEAVWLF